MQTPQQVGGEPTDDSRLDVPGSTANGGRVERLSAVRERLAVIGGLAVLVVLAMSIQGEPVYDDPYILFRFADNVATGHGWSFNPTSVTDNAVTSSLYVSMLAAGRFLGAHIPALAAALFFLATLATAVLTGLTLERLGHRTAGVFAAILLAVSPALTAVWGMESSLFLFLLAGALYSATTRRPAWVTGLLIALLVLARPDGILVGGMLIVVFFVIDRTRRLSFRSWLGLLTAAVVPIFLWGGFAVWQFGSALPSTLDAKRAQAASGSWPLLLSSGGIGLHISPDNLRGLLGGNDGAGELLVAVIVAAALLGLVAAVCKTAAWQVASTLVLSTAAICFVYGVVFRIPSYPWYWVLPIYALLVLAGLGFESVVAPLGARPTVRLVAVMFLALALIAGNLHEVRHGPNPTRTDYQYVGGWLQRNTPTGSTVAATEVGKMGWFSGRTMVDYLGLLDSRAISHVRRGDFEWWASYYQPDYWVTDGRFIDARFASSACFKQHFEAALERPTLTVYRRTSPVPQPGRC